MGDIKLFRLRDGAAEEIHGNASALEKPLQTLIENNLEPLLGIRFLATEYSTGKKHRGRIDSLGLDENNCPVIVEYKRSMSENVINQGLFYLDWLMDHQAEFQLLVLKKFGTDISNAIDWSGPRLICIAADFTKYDAHAVEQINRNIELIRYRRFGSNLLLFELANATTATSGDSASAKSNSGKSVSSKSKSKGDKTYAEIVASMDPALKTVLDSLETHILALGDDVQSKELKLYLAFKRLKNFATVVPQKSKLLLYLHLNPLKVTRALDTATDVTNKGHWGTGNVEVPLMSEEDLERVKPFLQDAYSGED